MSPFIFLPLLEFTFEGGAHTRQGAEFFKLFFYNLFVAEPNAAVLDVLDSNFGFEAICLENGRSIAPRLSAMMPPIPQVVQQQPPSNEAQEAQEE